MEQHRFTPRVVLMCHADDRIDIEGLSTWIAASMRLVGVIVLHEPPRRKLKRLRNEIRRVGWLRFLDVLAFRLYYRLRLARADAKWQGEEVIRLRSRYPASFDGLSTFAAADPNTEEVRRFLTELEPDLLIARCKFILKKNILGVARRGTYVLHPGICPEYRNAHGCFWALANRDLTRVGMTLLKADVGIDTGPMFLHAGYAFDELNESHVVIQYRSVTENLDALADMLIAACEGRAQALPVDGRRSATWGQPWLTAYWKWKSAARRASGSAAPSPEGITPR